MPVLFQKFIDREDLRRNPQVLYVFGDNIKRKGYGGQAMHMRGERNAVGVATKYTAYECFGEDEADIIAQNRTIDDDMRRLFEHVKRGGTVVWPHDGIGTGTAQLKIKSPTTFAYLETKLAALLRAAALFDKATHAD